MISSPVFQGNPLAGCLLFFCCFISFLGCASLPAAPSPLTNKIDSSYRLSRLKHIISTSQAESPGISFYQNTLSRTLGSHCSLYPSDSSYAQLLNRRCGGATAAVKAMSRFYFEPDASTLGAPALVNNGHIYFEDLPDDCRWF